MKEETGGETRDRDKETERCRRRTGDEGKQNEMGGRQKARDLWRKGSDLGRCKDTRRNRGKDMKEETREETRDRDKETERGRGRGKGDEGRQKEIVGREIEKDLGVG